MSNCWSPSWWIANGVITGALALLFAVFYVGANIDPADHLAKLPDGPLLGATPETDRFSFRPLRVNLTA
ncbi:hypothetical protein OG873_22345 [Streptomyces violaceus]|uniref:hypothetical protein n=1 Tax=Streptomyces violaceus TaxID=1936 RepID=UPI002E299476|nr:hypothetical protein [Streptomyces violaceus]